MAGAGTAGERQIHKAIGVESYQRGMKKKKKRDAHLRQQTQQLAEQKRQQLREQRKNGSVWKSFLAKVRTSLRRLWHDPIISN